MQTSYRAISLRQVVEDDLPFLFRLFADPGRCHLWMQGRRVYDESEFHQAWSGWSTDMMRAKFLVESAGRPVGLVFDYDRTLEDGHTKVTALLEENSTGHGGGVIATALLIGWLFETVPLRKVVMEVYGYNRPVLGMLRKIGFAEEGVLKELRFWDGVYWDLHVFTLARAGWPAVRDRVLRVPSAQRLRPATARVWAGQQEMSAELLTSSNGCLNGTT
jgi:RimJ/RimL family protein N-acetyltransferase